MKFNFVLKYCFLITFLIFNIDAYSFNETTTMPSKLRSLGSNNVASSHVPQVMQGVDIKENLGKSLDPELTFIDENGVTTKISDMLKDGKPLLVTLNYYRCSSLCSIQLINLAKTLADLAWPIGKDYKIVTVSFDPTDTVQKAKEKQSEYLSVANQKNGDWNFYIGNDENIKKLTDSLGFFYKYDPESKEFAHAAAIFVIGTNGTISRYLYGITYKARDIKFALMDASQNKIGTAADKVLLTCFHYNPTSGKYDAFAMGFLRIGAVLTMLSLLFIFVYFFWREKRKVYTN